MPGLDHSNAFEWKEVRGSALPASALFAQGERPVIRWIKANGLDDVVTRSAIAQATRLFGRSVDYCLCTTGIDAARVRMILAWAVQPVHWWPLDPSDNPELAALLLEAGCAPKDFGYWWKWFPERARPQGPEWILDGDMVVTRKPAWFEAWVGGDDPPRISESDEFAPLDRGYYGEYKNKVDRQTNLYSGLISLPPGARYMPQIVELMHEQPLAPGHDGRRNMSEQGVIAASFHRLGAVPIPLADFPFGRAFEESLDFGFAKEPGSVWGYHFGHAFRRENHHFVRLVNAGEIFWEDREVRAPERYHWLRNEGQWARAGLSMQADCVERLSRLCLEFVGRPILELGTSRGYLAAILADSGCIVVSVDSEDRGGALNLSGLAASVVTAACLDFLRASTLRYALIVVDLHGNDETVWGDLWPLVAQRVEPGGKIALYNSHLWKMPEWRSETGLKWLIDETPEGFSKTVYPEPLPGMIVLTREGRDDRPHQPDTPPLRKVTETPQPRPGQALNLLVGALVRWPEDARLHDLICQANESLGNRAAALEAARRASALAPHNLGYQGRLVRLLLSESHWAEAAAVARALLREAPSDASAHQRLGLALMRLDQPDEALAETRTAVRLRPEGFAFLVQLARFAFENGLVEEAESAARRAIAAAPGKPEGYRILSQVLLRRGDLSAAVEAAAEAVDKAPADEPTRAWLAALECRSARMKSLSGLSTSGG